MRGPDLAWQSDLWDAFPQFSDNVLQNIGWLQRYVRLSYGLHKLNKDYGKGLAKLVKKENKSVDDGSSVSISHRACLTQLTVLAGKHKQIAVSLGNLSKEYDTHIKRLLDQHKCVETEAKKLQSDLDNNIRKLDRSREKYEKRQNEADNAEDHLTKAEPDSRVSRAELEKIKDVADDAKIRATRARDEYSVQLNLTNSFQRGFYRETWPNVFTKLRRVGQDAEEGVNDLLSRLVSGGLDQWPEPVEAWGELDNCRELLDFKGDFSTFTILTKSGNPTPQDFSFIEPNHDVWSSPKSRFGSLRRTISRQSLKYRTPTLQRKGRFSSMLSLRGSTKMTRKSYKTETNTMNKSFDSIDTIDEETVSKNESADATHEIRSVTSKIASFAHDNISERSFATNGIQNYDSLQRTSTPVSRKPLYNPFKEENGNKFNPFQDENGAKTHQTGYLETNLDFENDEAESETISKQILSDLVRIIIKTDKNEITDTSNGYISYDDRKNPFMDDVYDDSLVVA